MLVLTRHCGEQIAIGEDVVVTVIAVEGKRVRIAVDAPESIRVDRKEVHDRRIARYDEEPSGYEIDTGCPVG